MSRRLIESARSLAERLHAGQRYGAEPYTVHLAAAVAVLERYVPATDPHFDQLVAAAWLHDAVEDTEAPASDLRAALGSDLVVDWVVAVSDAPGETRKARKAQTYARIRKAGRGAALVKLADRIANVEASLEGATESPEKLRMYREEWQGFRDALRPKTPSSAEAAMWSRLDELLG